MKNSLKSIGVVLVIILFLACRKTEVPTYQTAATAEIMLDVSYGSDPKQKMDVYLPANRSSNTNVIIFIHGGSFIGGDKNEFNTQSKLLLSKGYAVLNVNYRLVDGTGLKDLPIPTHQESSIKVKDQVADVSSIVDYAISHAKSWVVSGKRIGIAGHSAGASLALLYSYDVRNTNKIQAVSNIGGSLDLTFTDIPNYQFLPPFILEAGYRYTGKAIDPANEQLFKDISPLYTINANRLIPTINIFPQNNISIGFPKQDISVFNSFTAKLNDLKIKNQFVTIVGADHFLSRPEDWQFALNNTIAFFNENIK